MFWEHNHQRNMKQTFDTCQCIRSVCCYVLWKIILKFINDIFKKVDDTYRAIKIYNDSYKCFQVICLLHMDRQRSGEVSVK